MSPRFRIPDETGREKSRLPCDTELSIRKICGTGMPVVGCRLRLVSLVVCFWRVEKVAGCRYARQQGFGLGCGQLEMLTVKSACLVVKWCDGLKAV